MTWLVDACVLLCAEKAGVLPELLAASQHQPLAVVREVYREVAEPLSVKADVLVRARRTKSILDASNCHVVSIVLGSRASEVYAHLRARRTSANDAGECASVAYAAEIESVWFVTGEQAAAWAALRQLGGRVFAMPQFLRMLVDQNALDIDVALQIIAVDRFQPPPIWWPDWVAFFNPSPVK